VKFKLGFVRLYVCTGQVYSISRRTIAQFKFSVLPIPPAKIVVGSLLLMLVNSLYTKLYFELSQNRRNLFSETCKMYLNIQIYISRIAFSCFGATTECSSLSE